MPLLTVFHVNPPPPVALTGSTAVTTGGVDVTTAQLASPAGKTTGDFQAGRIADDINPLPSLDLTSDKYTEVEFVIAIAVDAVTDDAYEFRITAGGTPLDAYAAYPTATVGQETVSSNAVLNVTFGAMTLAAAAIVLTAAASVASFGTGTVVGTGTVASVASSSATFGAATGVATGTAAVAASSSATFDATTVVATATVTNPERLADANITFGAMASEGALQVAIQGAMSATFGAMAAQSAATLPIVAQSNTTFAAMGVVATTQAQPSAQSNTTFAAMGVVATSQTATAAVSSATFAASTSLGTAQSGVVAALASTFDAMTLDSEAVRAAAGTNFFADITFASMTLGATGIVATEGVASPTFAPTELSAALAVPITAQANLQLGAMDAIAASQTAVAAVSNTTFVASTLLGTAQSGVAAGVEATFGAMTLDSEATQSAPERSAVANLTFAPMTVGAVATLAITGAASSLFTPTELTATMGALIAAQVNSQLGTMVGVSTGVVEVVGVGDSPFGAMTLTSLLLVIVPAPPTGQVALLAESRVATFLTELRLSTLAVESRLATHPIEQRVGVVVSDGRIVSLDFEAPRAI